MAEDLVFEHSHHDHSGHNDSHNHGGKHEHYHTHDHSHNHENFDEIKRGEMIKIIVSAVFFVIGIVLEKLTHAPEALNILCFCISYLAVGFDIVKHAVEDVLGKNIFNECLMISVASLGAFALREFSEGCSVMLLYAVGEYIHGAALSKSKKQIRKIEEKEHGAHVHETTESESFIARFAKIYTPVITAIALIVMVVPPIFGGSLREWFYRGLEVLVIACPCAIVISVPLSFSCAIDACTKKGIYIYHSSALENLHKNHGKEGIIITEGNEREKYRFAHRAAKKAFDISRVNIVVALSVKAIVLVLAVFMKKEVPMWFAAFSDVGISVLAILNSLRALKIK